MRGKRYCLGLFSILLAGGMTLGQNYPAPRYPKVPEVKSADDLLEVARIVVRKPSRREPLRPGYQIKAGEKVLMVLSKTFTPLVRDALARAIKEEGAQLDILLLDRGTESIDHAHPGDRLPPDGTREAARMLEPGGGGGQGFLRGLIALGQMGRYDLIIEGGGGPAPVTGYRWERVPWDTPEKFVLAAAFPAEVQDLIDQKVWNTLKAGRRVHVVDPEGTDLTWSVKPAHFDRLRKEYKHDLYPPGTFDIVKRGHISLTPLFVVMPDIDTRGVVAGTINHAGVFPRVKLHVDGGKIVRVEAGGSYGEAVQALLKKYEEVQYPGFPDKGFGWFIEAALGTNPRIARATTIDQEGTTWERGRSGVIHWGFGVTVANTHSALEEYNRKVQAEKLPAGHFHVHTYFNTIDIEMEDGRTVRIADKGRLTFLDDPDVRSAAAKHGNPDEILSEAWIPAVPGINAPGRYEDYAANPGKWVQQDVENFEKQMR